MISEIGESRVIDYGLLVRRVTDPKVKFSAWSPALRSGHHEIFVAQIIFLLVARYVNMPRRL